MTQPHTGKPLGIEETPIPGFLRIDLTVHGDNRGWFKENWQREKMVALGLPDFHPVQNNISFNDEVGVTRGIHAEPWDKFVSVATGRVFGAWVDLREGPSFGQVYTCEIDPSVAVFVPAGVGNSYQTLEPNTAYTYLVNDHWAPDAQYTFLNLADETVQVPWPIPLDQAIQSDKDKAHPRLDAVVPFPSAKRPKVLVTGAGGQLGRELMRQLPEAGFEVRGVDLPEVDIADAEAVRAWDWSNIDIIINAAAWTDVDAAETPAGRAAAWRANAVGPAVLARYASEHAVTLVHMSTEYVFDGTATIHTEDETFTPLGVYAQSKAAGDCAVMVCPRHYLVRTSWVVGDGKNFIRTMANLARQDISPKVVSDQHGRLTFTADLTSGIIHLLRSSAPWGTYNLSGDGPVMNWAQIAAEVYTLVGKDPSMVIPITTDEYFHGQTVAPRPLNSVLDLSKLKQTGFAPEDASLRIAEYVASLRNQS
ncbi:sugar nucleotide-binding protein [Schaalia suimastitidis]|uniref:sugar nucleotide-binding protein n=1 Tax=Schaalia suimastitidis TaxID=121163 RepID=UPI0004038D9D|nr:sugar nucleotide-binding protein [Schaalia suimastitidis]